MAGLLGDQGNLLQLMGGLGLLQSDKRSEADRYMNLAMQGMSQASDKEKSRAEKERQDRLDKLAEEKHLSDLDYRKAQTAGLLSPDMSNSSKYANTPFYARDAKGNIKAYQLNNQGQPREIVVDEGFTPAIPQTPLDLGGQYQMMPRFGAPLTSKVPPQTIKKTLSPAQSPKHKADVIVAQEEARSKLAAKQDFSKEIEGAQGGLDLIERIRSHPGREMATGKSQPLGSLLSMVPGSDAKDFSSLLDQLKGQQFMIAYQQLKGGGQITEVEGKKAEIAISNMDKAQSEEQFLENITVLENILKNGIKRAESKSGETKKRVYNPSTGRFE